MIHNLSWIVYDDFSFLWYQAAQIVVKKYISIKFSHFQQDISGYLQLSCFKTVINFRLKFVFLFYAASAGCQ